MKGIKVSRFRNALSMENNEVKEELEIIKLMTVNGSIIAVTVNDDGTIRACDLELLRVIKDEPANLESTEDQVRVVELQAQLDTMIAQESEEIKLLKERLQRSEAKVLSLTSIADTAKNPIKPVKVAPKVVAPVKVAPKK